MNKSIQLLYLFLCSFSLLAQDIEQDMRNMNTAYQELENFSTSIDIEMDLEEDNNSPFGSAIMHKRGDDFFIKMGNIVQIQNTRCRLVINHDEKHISYSEPDKAALENMVTQSFDELWKQQDLSQFKFIAEKAGQKHYQLIKPGAIIQQMDIYLNSKNYLLEALEYSYNPDIMGEDQQVAIRYTGNNTQPVFKVGQFSEAAYVRRKKGEVSLQAAYQTYTLFHLKNKETNEQ